VSIPTDPPPSRTILRDRDDRRDDSDPRLITAKRQVAVVRALADELERCLVRGTAAPTIRDQLVRELAWLGRRSLEIAAALSAKTAPAEEKSGVFAVPVL
jgi:hypothetical protein